VKGYRNKERITGFLPKGRELKGKKCPWHGDKGGANKETWMCLARRGKGKTIRCCNEKFLGPVPWGNSRAKKTRQNSWVDVGGVVSKKKIVALKEGCENPKPQQKVCNNRGENASG